jgi:hypothetical protein
MSFLLIIVTSCQFNHDGFDKFKYGSNSGGMLLGLYRDIALCIGKFMSLRLFETLRKFRLCVTLLIYEVGICMLLDEMYNLILEGCLVRLCPP